MSFDPEKFVEAIEAGDVPSGTILLTDGDFLFLTSWLAIKRSPHTSSCAVMGVITLSGPHGPVVVKGGSPFVVEGDGPEVETARKFLEWYYGKFQDYLAKVLLEGKDPVDTPPPPW